MFSCFALSILQIQLVMRQCHGQDPWKSSYSPLCRAELIKFPIYHFQPCQPGGTGTLPVTHWELGKSPWFLFPSMTNLSQVCRYFLCTSFDHWVFCSESTFIFGRNSLFSIVFDKKYFSVFSISISEMGVLNGFYYSAHLIATLQGFQLNCTQFCIAWYSAFSSSLSDRVCS